MKTGRAVIGMRRMIGWLLSLSLVAICGSACGEPQFYSPSALQVVFMPLSGSIEVDPGIVLNVFFSSALDENSVNTDFVYLQKAIKNPSCDAGTTECNQCGSWEEEHLSPTTVNVENGSAEKPTNKLILTPGSGLLEKGQCYRLTITTAVQGLTVGPLEDMNIPASCRKGVGAQETFYTVQQ